MSSETIKNVSLTILKFYFAPVCHMNVISNFLYTWIQAVTWISIRYLSQYGGWFSTTKGYLNYSIFSIWVMCYSLSTFHLPLWVVISISYLISFLSYYSGLVKGKYYQKLLSISLYLSLILFFSSRFPCILCYSAIYSNFSVNAVCGPVSANWCRVAVSKDKST